MRKFNIPVFVPHKGCPYDCVFCNQKRITGNLKETTPDVVTRIIDVHLKTLPSKGRTIEVAFFGGSFTGIPIDEQSALMARVKPYIESGEVDGIRLSTRPDYITDEILQNLKNYGVTTIELGVQSMVDSVLKASNRGHTSDDVTKSVKLIRDYGFSLGLQMMTGLPGDTPTHSIETAKRIIALKPDFVRIYPTLTIKDTYLEKMYHKGEYQPQSLDAAVELAKELLLMFESNGISVIRIGLQPTDEINENASVVAGPFHSSFGELVESAVYYDIIEDAIKGLSGDVLIYVNPKEVSKATGNKCKNIIKIKDNTGINIKIATDDNLKRREVRYTCF